MVQVLHWRAHCFPSAKSKGVLGIQLYTVRDDMKKISTGNIETNRRYRLQECGACQLQGKRKFYGYAPAEFKKILADMGMKKCQAATPNWLRSIGMNQKKILQTPGNIQ